MIASASTSGSIVQSNHYYPFGMSFAEGSATSQQPYKYNGKELDTERGLNLYDYSARYMDPVLGRFNTVDPMAEKYYSWFPYMYVGNNPIIRTDQTRMIWDDPKEAEKFKKDIDKNITSLNKDIAKNQVELDKGGLSEKRIAKLESKISEANDRISNLTTSKGDIDNPGADKDNIYDLSNIPGGNIRSEKDVMGVNLFTS